MTASAECLVVCQGKPELIRLAHAPAPALVGPRMDVPVSADHPAQVAAPVVEAVLRPLSEGAHSHQLVVDRQERALRWSLPGPGHVLPAALGQEAMVAA